MSQAKSTQKVVVDDIWTIIEKEPITAAIETTLNSSLVFAGDFSSGKTTLINSFLKPKDSKETKPTIALDYNFARKVVGNVKTVANFW
jgi:GTPase SAR1 family protein